MTSKADGGAGPHEPAALRAQVAALPYRLTPEVQILLLTSRDTGRWVLPKGWPMKGRKGHEAARREALEEAGLEGRVGKRAIGAYRYQKRLPGGGQVECEVEVFPMAVASQRRRWREKGQRRLQWFSPAEAAALVEEPGLAELLARFAPP